MAPVRLDKNEVDSRNVCLYEYYQYYTTKTIILTQCIYRQYDSGNACEVFDNLYSIIYNLEYTMTLMGY